MKTTTRRVDDARGQASRFVSSDRIYVPHTTMIADLWSNFFGPQPFVTAVT